MFSFWEVLCTAPQCCHPLSRQLDPSMSIYRIIALTPSCKLGWRGFWCTYLHAQGNRTNNNFVFILMNGKASWNPFFPVSYPVHLESKSQVPRLKNHFIYIAIRLGVLAPCQKCCALGAVQTALGPAEEFLITSAISWIHFHSELWQECKGNHITDQLSFTF